MNAPSSSPSSSVRAAVSTLGFALLVAACGSKPTTTTNDTPPPPQRRVPVAASASNSASAPRLELTEGDFTPSDQSRDPFRGYAEIFAATAGKKNATQQKIVADRYSLDELKLVAVITGNTASRAMFVDPAGKGHVVTRGELVGRSESVRATAQKGIQSYEASWKVDRIREGDVVFIREDPERPNVAAATRVIALRPEGDPTPARRLSPTRATRAVCRVCYRICRRALAQREGARFLSGRRLAQCGGHFGIPPLSSRKSPARTWPRTPPPSYDGRESAPCVNPSTDGI